MKTNITMQSSDRELFGVTIRQQTQMGFLCLTDLQEAYTRARILNGWHEKGKIQDIIAQRENVERIYYVLKERGLVNSDLSELTLSVEKIGVIKYLKQLKVYKTSGGQRDRTTWCDPYIWVLVAMELSPAIYGKVVIWLTDKLILNRIEAGNFYKGLSQVVSKFQNVDYVKLSITLNKKIFGRHETGMRNLASKEELKKMYELESYIAKSCDMGHLKSFEDCIKEIERY